MKQALHIFRKDLFRLRVPALIFGGLVLAFVVMDLTYRPGVDSTTEVPRAALEVLMTLVAWWLVESAVHEEPLSGDREFWLTRPYDRGALLLAKAMVLGATISVPLLVADCAIVGLQGLPLFSNAGGLALRVVATATWLILPALAIAALTRDLTQNALGWFVVAIWAIVLVQWKSESPFLNDDYAWNIVWVLAVMSAVLMAVSVLLQYRGVGVVWGRVVFAAALLPPAIPVTWDMALALQPGQPEGERAGRIQIVSDPGRRLRVMAGPSGGNTCLEVPVSVMGLEEGWQLVTLGGSVVVQGGSGSTQEAWLNRKEGEYWQTGCLGERVRPEASVDMTVVPAVTAEEPLRIGHIRQNVLNEPGVGRCRVARRARETGMLCSAAVRPPARGTVQMNVVDGAEARTNAVDISYFPHSWAPLQVLPGYSPVFKWFAMPGKEELRPAMEGAFVELSLLKRRPVALIKRTYTVNDAEIGAWRK